jgi:hypothetical protein
VLPLLPGDGIANRVTDVADNQFRVDIPHLDTSGCLDDGEEFAVRAELESVEIGGVR